MVSKLGTYKFCTENDIPVPRLYYSNISGVIGSVDEIFKHDDFVIKIESTCSTVGIYPLIKIKNDHYKCVFKKKRSGKMVDITMTRDYITKNILNNHVFVEESIITYDSNNSPIIPFDYKVYVINNEYKIVVEINRNVGKKGEISIYNLKSGSNISSDYFSNSNYPINCSNKIDSEKINIIDNFLKKHVYKLNHNGLISWDLYIHNNCCYLGEFTLHPGLLHYSNVKTDYCRMLNQDLQNCLYQNCYEFKTINVNNLETDIIEGNFHYNYKKCDFLLKKKQNNKYLLITFHGSVDTNLQLPIFRCFDFNEENIY